MKPQVATMTVQTRGSGERTPAGDEDRLLRVGDVAGRLGISARGVWKMLAADRLPTPVRLGRAVRWRSSDIALAIELGIPSREVFEQARAARCSR